MRLFEQTKEISTAVNVLNGLIRQVISSGGSVYLVEKSHPDFSIKLTADIDIACYEPINFGKRHIEY